MKRPSHDQRGYHCLATNAINNTSEVGQAIAKRSGTFSLTFFIKGDEARNAETQKGPAPVSQRSRRGLYRPDRSGRLNLTNSVTVGLPQAVGIEVSLSCHMPSGDHPVLV